MKLDKKTDEECLKKFIKLLDRVDVETLFLIDDDGIVKRQALKMTCGELEAVSEFQDIPCHMKLITPEEAGETIN